jgi:hypothetical protein
MEVGTHSGSIVNNEGLEVVHSGVHSVLRYELSGSEGGRWGTAGVQEGQLRYSFEVMLLLVVAAPSTPLQWE